MSMTKTASECAGYPPADKTASECSGMRSASTTASDARHASDCALHNEPAMPAGPCDCGLAPST